MKSEQVIAAINYFIQGKREDAVAIVRQIEASETTAGNTNTARRIRNILNSSVGQFIALPTAPPSIQFWAGSRNFESVILADGIRSQVERFILEYDKRELLSQHGVPVRKTIMLSGPSGNGKTTLACAIASKLGMPLGVVQYEEIIDSYRGKTLDAISKAMNYANANRCVLLFDEADSLVSTRMSGAKDSGREDNRSVNGLLMKMDAMAGDSIVIFATNMGGDIDPALIRRIGMRIELNEPREGNREQMVALMEKRWPIISGGSWIGAAMTAASLAEIEEIAIAAAREKVLLAA